MVKPKDNKQLWLWIHVTALRVPVEHWTDICYMVQWRRVKAECLLPVWETLLLFFISVCTVWRVSMTSADALLSPLHQLQCGVLPPPPWPRPLPLHVLTGVLHFLPPTSTICPSCCSAASCPSGGGEWEGPEEGWSDAGFKGQGCQWRILIGRLLGRLVCVSSLFLVGL